MVFVGVAGVATDSTLGFLVKSRMAKALERFGTLKWQDVMAPAVALARRGMERRRHDVAVARETSSPRGPRERTADPEPCGLGTGIDAARWERKVAIVERALARAPLTAGDPLGALAAVGNAGGNSFTASVIPFLLRGVSLLGINSVYQPPARRQQAWQRLAQVLDPTMLEATIQEIGLAEVTAQAQALLAGQVQGRLVVDVRR